MKKKLFIGAIALMLLGALASPSEKKLTSTSNTQKAIPTVSASQPLDYTKGGDVKKIKHGNEIVISGEVVAGNGRESGRSITTSFGNHNSQPFILEDSSGREWIVALNKPSATSVFEKKLIIKGIADLKTDDPALSSKNRFAIVKAEILHN